MVCGQVCRQVWRWTFTRVAYGTSMVLLSCTPRCLRLRFCLKLPLPLCRWRVWRLAVEEFVWVWFQNITPTRLPACVLRYAHTPLRPFPCQSHSFCAFFFVSTLKLTCVVWCHVLMAQAILRRLATCTTLPCTPVVDLVFFDRLQLNTHFAGTLIGIEWLLSVVSKVACVVSEVYAESMRGLAKEIRFLDSSNLQVGLCSGPYPATFN